MSRLAQYVHQQRLERKWSFGELARQVGYRNLAKGANKLCALEREGIATPELWRKVVEALGLEPRLVMPQ